MVMGSFSAFGFPSVDSYESESCSLLKDLYREYNRLS